MISKEFSSGSSKDLVEILYFKKSHKSNLKIKVLDDVTENIKIIGEIITFLKNGGVQWICISIKNDPIIPENTVWFKHEKSGSICCHIEDFEHFYLKNFMSIVSPNQLYLELSDDKSSGWTVVVDKRKLRATKLNKVKNDINTLVQDWNKL